MAKKEKNPNHSEIQKRHFAMMQERGIGSIFDTMEFAAQNLNITTKELLKLFEAKRKNDEKPFAEKDKTFQDLVSSTFDLTKDFAKSMHFTAKQLIQALGVTDKKKTQLADAIHKVILSESISVIKDKMRNVQNGNLDRSTIHHYLEAVKDIAEIKKQDIEVLLKLLDEWNKTEANQQAREEELKFMEIEKEVLAYIGEVEAKRMATMRSWLQKEYGDRYETSYKQVIMKIHTGEVMIRENSVRFNYAGKELFKQELQLPTTEDGNIFDYEYEDFDGTKISRRKIKQRVLDEDNANYHLIQEAKEELKKEGKYIIGSKKYDDSDEIHNLDSIFDGFEGEQDQKIKAMQFLTGFIGRGLISLEKDKNGKCRVLESKCYEENTTIHNNKYYQVSLLIGKDI